MEEGKLPSMYSIDDEKKINEERRIAYVAFNRAKKRLFLFCSGVEEKTSKFVEDVKDLILKTVDMSKDYVAKEEKQTVLNYDV